MNRRAVADDVVGDAEIPAGAFISLSPDVTHRMSEFWKDPDCFRPDRFLPNNCAMEQFASLPFSAGARGCIGEHFAIMEIVLVLATEPSRRASCQRIGGADRDPPAIPSPNDSGLRDSRESTDHVPSPGASAHVGTTAHVKPHQSHG